MLSRNTLFEFKFFPKSQFQNSKHGYTTPSIQLRATRTTDATNKQQQKLDPLMLQCPLEPKTSKQFV